MVAEGPISCWLRSNYSEYFITWLCKVLSECTAHPIFTSLQIICFLRYVASSVDDIIVMAKASMVVAEVSPEKLTPLESVAFEDREPTKVGELKAVLGYNSS